MATERDPQPADVPAAPPWPGRAPDAAAPTPPAAWPAAPPAGPPGPLPAAPPGAQVQGPWAAPSPEGAAHVPPWPGATGYGVPVGPAPPPVPGWAVPGRPDVPDAAEAAPVGRWGLPDALLGLVLWLGLSTVFGLVVVLWGQAQGVIDLYDASLDSDELQRQITEELGAALLVATALAGLVGFVGWTWVVSRWKGSGSLRRDIGLAFRWTDLGWGVAGGMGSLLLTGVIGVAYQLISGEEAPTNTDDILGEGTIGAGTAVVMLVCVGLIVPFAEEVFFRGLVLGAMRKRFHWLGAVIASSVVFGFLHGFTGAGLSEGAFVAGVTTLFGLVFALLRVLLGRLGPAVVAHVFNNTAAVAVVVATQSG